MISTQEELIRQRDLLVDQIKVAAHAVERRRLYDDLEAILRQLRAVQP